MNKLTLQLFLLFILSFSFVNTVKAQFVHPGITHKKSDLDRIKHMVEAEVDPWYTSYQEMILDPKSSYDYVVQGDPSFTELGRNNKVNYGAWNSDIRAAYYNALRWYVEDDTRYAEKAIEIFNAWVNLEAVTSNGTMALSGGVGYIMIEAAEIIKHTYNGWSETDRKKFEDMLVFPGYSNTQVPASVSRSYGTFYWQSYQGDSGRHGNQGLSGWRTVMAIGIFLDNEIIYDRALRYIKGLPHRSDDLPYPSGPPTIGELLSSTEYVDTYRATSGTSIPDYGFNEVMTNYIYENGQCQESSRDQQHTAFGIGLLTSMAEMAWNQGDDLYSHANDRLLSGLEYNMRYNVSAIQSYPDQTTPWEPTVTSGEFEEGFDRTGRWYSKAISPDGRGEFPGVRPVYEMPVAHYLGRGLKNENDVLWTKRARDKAIEISGYEAAGWTNDAIGWGALTARRPAYCYGDPISGFDGSGLPIYNMNTTESTIEAENFDYDPIHQGEGRIYHDLSTSNTGGAYRIFDGVDIESTPANQYNITSIQAGEWLTYTVAVPKSALYSITINYAALQSGGTMKINVGGEDKTTDVEVPFGVPNSTGATDWKSFTIAEDILLEKGVQSFKIMFNGTSESFKLDSFSIVQTGIAKSDQTIEFFTISDKVVGSADFDPEAKASSDLEVIYSSSNPSVATIVNGKVHIVGAGTTTIIANQSGNEFFNAAPSVDQQLRVVDAVEGTLSLDADADAYVHESNPNNNYGSAEVLVTKVEGRYAFLKFNLSSIPGPIVSATLRIYQRTGFRDLRAVYDVEDDSWTENGITWNNKPAFDNERASVTTTSTWSEWDISSYAAQEYNGDKIITVAVKDPANSGTGIDFRSKEFGPDYAPELVVEYSSEALSVNEIKMPIELYPNPATKELNVYLGNFTNTGKTTLSLYTLKGEKVMEVSPEHDKAILNLSKLSAGVYVLLVKNGDKIASKKIVKI
ncbi:putative secreted protein (Por secretion system target) [Jejuia pallidilutea]|uniref:Putative secreted protein (Por secretion system target) n=1 Tax=Jejuia pallidilutea TaxID=504487 RepID=A0A362X0B8_9FLAO|nr:DNRLRE domain-containing protein [Jejuia pallidilutea]PQV49009.1 putative secreted protein (Por secretion system target) [Jejuia pallidilutea]